MLGEKKRGKGVGSKERPILNKMVRMNLIKEVTFQVRFLKGGRNIQEKSLLAVETAEVRVQGRSGSDGGARVTGVEKPEWK